MQIVYSTATRIIWPHADMIYSWRISLRKLSNNLCDIRVLFYLYLFCIFYLTRKNHHEIYKAAAGSGAGIYFLYSINNAAIYCAFNPPVTSKFNSDLNTAHLGVLPIAFEHCNCRHPNALWMHRLYLSIELCRLNKRFDTWTQNHITGTQHMREIIIHFSFDCGCKSPRHRFNNCLN
jgi:hypothetical protein